MNQTLLCLKDVKKYFPVTRGVILRQVKGWVQAVDGVSFSLIQGETFALVGESGCGKTTLARLILRIEQPTAGSLQFDGQEIPALKGEALVQYRRETQAVFQDPYSSLNPRWRVRDIISEPLQAARLARKDVVKGRVQELLEKVGLAPGSGNLFPHQFSGGQRQRIAIARALASNPRLILLDEPVSALDVSIRAQIMNLLKDLQQQSNLAYLIIAHDLGTVRYMATNVGVMYLGKLVEVGSTEVVYSNPLHPYTRALLAGAFLPDPDQSIQEEEFIAEGEVPSALNPPSGCRFHPRCPLVMEPCSKEEPPLKPVEGRLAACHLYNR